MGNEIKTQKNTWRGIGFAFKVFIYFYLANLAAQFFVSELATFYAIGGFTGGTYQSLLDTMTELSASDGYSYAVGIIFDLAIAIWFGLWYRRAFYLPSVEEKGTLKDRIRLAKNPALNVAALVLLALGFIYVVNFAYDLLTRFAPKLIMEYQSSISGQGFDKPSVVLFIYVVILAPIAEEFTFRGLIFEGMKKESNFWVANICQALIFASVHANLIQSAYTFVMALGLGYICEKSGNILLAIGYHMIFNIFGVMLADYIPVPDGSNPVVTFIVLFAALNACYIGMRIIITNHTEKTE